MKRILLGLAVLLLAACSQSEPLGADAGWSIATQNFVSQGFEPQVGDQVWARVFDEVGQEVVFEKLDITAPPGARS